MPTEVHISKNSDLFRFGSDPKCLQYKISRIDTALEVFIKKKRVLASDADVISQDYVELCKKKSVMSKLTEFYHDKDRLDTVLIDILEKGNADI